MQENRYNILPAMRLLIESSRYWQDEMKSYEHRNKSNYYNNPENKIAFLKEFCTIKICSSRRAGHTTAIARCAVEDFNNPMIITYCDTQSEIIKEYIKFLYPDLPISKFNNIICEHKNSKYLYGIPKVDAIFVDTASILSSSSLDNIYQLAKSYSNNNSSFFVVLVE